MVEGDEIQNDVIPLGNDDEEMDRIKNRIFIGAFLLIGVVSIFTYIFMGWAWYFSCSLIILPIGPLVSLYSIL